MRTIILSLLLISCASMALESVKNSKYEVLSLTSSDTHEIIYLKKDDRTFKLISKKIDFGCENIIIVGEKYYFDLKSVFEIQIKNNHSIFTISEHANIDCIKIDSEQFCKEHEKGIYDIYSTVNLKGLCYIAN